MEDQKQINILGFGIMGRQIAALFSTLGFSVNVWTRRQDAERTKRFSIDLKIIRRSIDVENSEIKEVKFFDKVELLPQAITIEALIEDCKVKQEAILDLSFSTTDFPVFTNSSSIPALEIGKNVGAMHFFNPIAAVKIIELFLPDDNSLEIIDYLNPLTSAGYEIVPVFSNTGMIGNFMLFTYISEFLFLIEEKNYLPEQISKVMGKLNMPVNPLDVINIVGVDVVLDIIRNIGIDRPGIYVSQSLINAIEAGVLGRKNKTCFAKFLNEQGLGSI